jgi:hypothetical protein
MSFVVVIGRDCSTRVCTTRRSTSRYSLKIRVRSVGNTACASTIDSAKLMRHAGWSAISDSPEVKHTLAGHPPLLHYRQLENNVIRRPMEQFPLGTFAAATEEFGLDRRFMKSLNQYRPL